jgi:hypothetical protein
MKNFKKILMAGASALFLGALAPAQADSLWGNGDGSNRGVACPSHGIGAVGCGSGGGWKAPSPQGQKVRPAKAPKAHDPCDCETCMGYFDDPKGACREGNVVYACGCY